MSRKRRFLPQIGRRVNFMRWRPIECVRQMGMMELTRLNGHTLLVNADLIKHVEAIPDTTLTLVTGDKLVVLETCAEVLGRTLQWRTRVLQAAWPSAENALSAHHAHAAEALHRKADESGDE